MYMQNRFHFLSVCSGKLKVPNLANNFKWTGDKVKKNAGQGDIYIRSNYTLKLGVNAAKVSNYNNIIVGNF